MKLRVIDASGLGYWYKTRIGDVFEVVSVWSGIQKYEVLIEGVTTGYVDFIDAAEYFEANDTGVEINGGPDTQRQTV